MFITVPANARCVTAFHNGREAGYSSESSLSPSDDLAHPIAVGNRAKMTKILNLAWVPAESQAKYHQKTPFLISMSTAHTKDRGN